MKKQHFEEIESSNDLRHDAVPLKLPAKSRCEHHV